MLKGKTVVLGVTGSIAAYKIANLASMLVKKHANVHVIMTENACNFINPITFETLTGNKCLVDTFDRNFQFNVEHVSLAKLADIFLVAPASADVIGKIANGIADDMLTTTIMACKCPKLISPAMNTSSRNTRKNWRVRALQNNRACRRGVRNGGLDAPAWLTGNTKPRIITMQACANVYMCTKER